MSITSNNDNDNENSTIDMSGLCSMCGKIRPFLERNVRVYYQSGNKMRLENLCFDLPSNNDTSTSS